MAADLGTDVAGAQDVLRFQADAAGTADEVAAVSGDAFAGTWLDESTVDALGTFLQQRADETKSTPDQLLLAFFYVKKGDDIAAIQLFDEALAANPGSAATWCCQV